MDNGKIRQFATGATRDTSKDKLEPYGFISPLALHRFSEYMHKHRFQSDGTVRDSDNWKRGIPISVYMHSLVRHVFDFWLVMTGLQPRFDTKVSDPVEIACAIMFNVQGFLHEALLQREIAQGFTHGLQVNGQQVLAGPLENVPEDLNREVDEAFERLVTDSASPDVVVGTLTNAQEMGFKDWTQERVWK